MVPDLKKISPFLRPMSEMDPDFSALIVDRDLMSSQLLAEALSRERGYKAAAASPSDFPQRLSSGTITLAVVGADQQSVLGGGFRLVNSAHRSHPEVAFIILIEQATRESVIHAFRAGARGVFCRHQPIADFLDCVEHVRRGHIWAAKNEADFLLEAFESMPATSVWVSASSSPLTNRELEVVRHAAQGKTNKTIASELFLSEHTVKNYLFHAFEKLGVSSRIELLFYLMTMGHSPQDLSRGVSKGPVIPVVGDRLE